MGETVFVQAIVIVERGAIVSTHVTLKPGDRVLLLATVVAPDPGSDTDNPPDWVSAYPLSDATVERLARAARYVYFGDGWPMTSGQVAMWSGVVRAVIAELIGEAGDTE